MIHSFPQENLCTFIFLHDHISLSTSIWTIRPLDVVDHKSCRPEVLIKEDLINQSPILERHTVSRDLTEPSVTKSRVDALCRTASLGIESLVGSQFLARPLKSTHQFLTSNVVPLTRATSSNLDMRRFAMPLLLYLGLTRSFSTLPLNGPVSVAWLPRAT
jgi:hypothetical protein